MFRHRDRWGHGLRASSNRRRSRDTRRNWRRATTCFSGNRRTILARGEKGAWDQANAAGGVALFDPAWGGTNSLQTHEGRYWMSCNIGGKGYGYEAVPLHIGIASTADPSKPQPWSKLPRAYLTTTDRDVRPGETGTLYKSYILKDETKSLGARFVMFYNAKPRQGSEKLFVAVSDGLQQWRRVGTAPVIENLAVRDSNRGVISGDPQVVRMRDVWVMFYFGAFWKPGAFDTFAASRDLIARAGSGRAKIRSGHPSPTTRLSLTSRG